MCLEKIKSKNSQIAKKDLTCYKVLEKTNTGKLASPYFKKYWKVQKLYKNRTLPEINTSSSFLSFYYNLKGGVYHTFTNKKIVLNELNGWSCPMVLVECTIPKGSKYWKWREYKLWV